MNPNHTDPPADTGPAKRRAPKANAAKPAARRRVRVAEGIYRDRHGLAATVKVNGVQREIRFPSGTPLKTIRARRDELRASLRTLPTGERHTLAYDAKRYLKQINGELVSIADRRYYVGQWAARFGYLRTLALPQHTAALNDQLRQWRETLSVSACNHRRDALTNLVKVLYGRRAAADLVDLVRFRRPPPRPRWLDRAHIAEVLAHLTPGSNTVVRLRLMHWTECGRRRWDAYGRRTSASTSRHRSSSCREVRAGGSPRSHSSAKGSMRPASSWPSAPTDSGPARVRTGPWRRLPDARDVRRSPSIRFGIRSRRGFGGPDRTWRTFRICTGTRIPRRR